MIKLDCCPGYAFPDSISALLYIGHPSECVSQKIGLQWQEGGGYAIPKPNAPAPAPPTPPVAPYVRPTAGIACGIISGSYLFTCGGSFDLGTGCSGGGSGQNILFCSQIGGGAPLFNLPAVCCQPSTTSPPGTFYFSGTMVPVASPMPQYPICPEDGGDGGNEFDLSQSDQPAIKSGDPIRYSSGEVVYQQTDVAADGFGIPWGHTRSFASRLSNNESIGHGYNWQIAQWSYLVLFNPSNGSSIPVMGMAEAPYWFDLVNGSYVARYGVKKTLEIDTTAQVYRLRSLNGSYTEFDEFTGMFKRIVDPAGNSLVVQATATNGFNFTDVQRTYVSGGQTVVEQWLYTYDTSMGDHLLSSITLRRQTNGGAWLNVSQALYTYYGIGSSYGGPEDLQTATTQVWNGSTWSNTGTSLYRYYRTLGASSSSSSSSPAPSSSSSTSSYKGATWETTVHLLKYIVQPASYARLAADPNVSNPLTASDGIVAQYADYFYEYDSGRRVSRELVQGGSRSFSFSYVQSAFSDDYNHWKYKTTETQPDDSQNIIYANFAGQTMLSVHKADSDIWCDFYLYNGDGKQVLHAHPSAISGYNDTFADLLHKVNGNYEFLKDYQGLVEAYDIHGPTGRIASKRIRQGEFGACIRLYDMEYTAFYANSGSGSSSSSGSSGAPSGTPVYFLTRKVVYPDDGCGCDCNSSSSSSSSCSFAPCCSNDRSRQIVTNYAYSFHSGTAQVKQKTTTLPAIPVDQNGSGISATRKEYFDAYGNLTWNMDERGFITGMSYDIPTASIIQKIEDVDTSLVSAPLGWVTPSGGGLHLITDYQHDDRGRMTQSLGPVHTIDINGAATANRRASWTVYQDAGFQNWSGQGFATGNSPSYAYTLVNPVLITRTDANGKVLEQISAVRSSTNGKLQATDSFPQSTYVRWTTNQYTDCCLAASQRIYHTIPTNGSGSSGMNYDETVYGYDVMKRQTRVVSPGGTITYRVFNTRGEVVSVYIGTNDAGAMDQNPTGSGASGNNMVAVTSQEFDNDQAGGDTNVTKSTQQVDATTGRVTRFLYDWRNRRIATDGELEFYELICYDNVDRVLRIDRRDTTASGNLIVRIDSKYDDQSRVFRTTRYGVNPATGEVGYGLTDNIWYDGQGKVVKSMGTGSQLFVKTIYDSLGRATFSYNGYDLDETTYAEVGSISDDVILEQSETSYDTASNVIQITRRQRYHNAPDTQKGPLQNSSSSPKARVTYYAKWPDAIGRNRASADYGTNAGTGLSRPNTIPPRNDTTLVTSSEYDSTANLAQTTDATGMITRFTFDATGRQASRTVNYIPTSSSSSSSSNDCSPSFDQNVTAAMTYNQDGNLLTLTAGNSLTGNQTTQYVYGTTLSNSNVATSTLKRMEIYPDSVDSTDVIVFAYNRQGQIMQTTDQSGSVHQYDFDLLGRQTQDRITILGTGVDGAVRRIATTFEVRGMLAHSTSYDNATVGMGSVVNDCQFVYDSFSQRIAEYQSHIDAVNTGTTPKVQYGFATGSANTIRPTSMTYPNGRVLTYSYGTANGIDDAASRVASLIDNNGTTHLADYSYLGLRTFVETDYTEPDVKFTLIGTAGGNDPDTGDVYRGLDRFGRVKDSYWYNYASSTDADRIKYGYDRIGNVLYRENTVASAPGAKFDELYQYDAIHRLKHMDRGNLNGSKTGFISTTFKQCWTLDETGNWRGFRQDDTGDGTWDLVQSRTTNLVNEISDISETAGPSWVTPAYSRSGNMTTVPQPLAPTASYVGTYDAWNRLVKLVSGANTVSQYEYDGAKRRIVQKSYAAGTLTETRHLYYTRPTQWQVIEERLGTSPSSANPNRQFVWGSRYIDDLVLRDRDTNGDGTLDERLYALQDANWNVTAISSAAGSIQERMIYSAYGEPRFLGSAWIQQSDGYNWETLYAGYCYQSGTGLYHVRHRVFHAPIGAWTQRDPRASRSREAALAAYCEGSPLSSVDPLGLQAVSAQGFYDCRSDCEDQCWTSYQATNFWFRSAFRYAACVDTCATECTLLNPNTVPPTGASCVSECVQRNEMALIAELVGGGVTIGYIGSQIPCKNFSAGASKSASPTLLGNVGGKLTGQGCMMYNDKTLLNKLGNKMLAEQNLIHSRSRAVNRALFGRAVKTTTGIGRCAAVGGRIICRTCQIVTILEAPIFAWCSSECLSNGR
jgi:RHS repeat-associated protein